MYFRHQTFKAEHMVHTECLYITEVSCFSKTSGATIPAFSTAYDANFKLMAISYWSENPKQIGILNDQGIKGGDGVDRIHL
jgi:hypothetical protein